MRYEIRNNGTSTNKALLSLFDATKDINTKSKKLYKTKIRFFLIYLHLYWTKLYNIKKQKYMVNKPVPLYPNNPDTNSAEKALVNDSGCLPDNSVCPPN